jgi:hypothetical protein
MRSDRCRRLADRGVVGRLACALICAAIMGPGMARGQAPAERATTRAFEATPFVGYRLGGRFDLANTPQRVDLDDHRSFALALDLRRDEGSQYELFYARQTTHLESNSTLGPLGVDVEYFQVGGTLVVDEAQRGFSPYIVGTVGATRFTPDPGGASDNTRFSVSLGGGIRVPLSERFGLRLEARGYLTFVNADAAIFCASNAQGGICSIHASGSTFFQYEVLAGAAFVF